MPSGPNRWLFDVWSRVYDLPLVQRLSYRPEQDVVLRHLGGRTHRRVLDLGCGTGILATRVRRTFARIEVVGCDFSRGMLQRAAGRGPSVRWVQGDALHLPFGDSTFDAAYSTEAFHWFLEPDVALRELHRVLCPGGALLVALVDPPSGVGRLTFQKTQVYQVTR